MDDQIFIFCVAVISYNSAATIVETLDSIKNQSVDLKDIHLVISDDASSDLTIDVVNKWISNNGKLFGRCSILLAEKNTGVTANFNRALRCSKGHWIKPIAADDLLSKNCLSDNFEFVLKANVSICFSPVYGFFGNIGDSNHIIYEKWFFSLSAKEQNILLRRKNFVHPTSLFFSKDFIERLGYADEKFIMLEDYPLFYKITGLGYSLKSHETPTVYYRYTESLSNNKSKIANASFIKSVYDFKRSIIWRDLPKSDLFVKWADSVSYLSIKTAIYLFSNKNNFLSRAFIKVCALLSPYHIYKFSLRFFKKKFA